MKKLIILVLAFLTFGLGLTNNNSTISISAASSSAAVQNITLNSTITFNDGTFGTLESTQANATVSSLGYATGNSTNSGIILKGNYSLSIIAPLTLSFDWATNVSQALRLTYGQVGSSTFTDYSVANGLLVPGANSKTVTYTFTPTALTGKIQIAMFNDRNVATDIQQIDNVRLSNQGSATSSSSTVTISTPSSVSPSSILITSSVATTSIVSSSKSSSITPSSIVASTNNASVCTTPSFTTVNSTLINGECIIFLCNPGIATLASQCANPSIAQRYADSEYGPCVLTTNQTYCNVPAPVVVSRSSIRSSSVVPASSSSSIQSSSVISNSSVVTSSTATASSTSLVCTTPSFTTVNSTLINGECIIYLCKPGIATLASQCANPSIAQRYADSEYGPCVLTANQTYCNVPAPVVVSSSSTLSSSSSNTSQTVTCNNTNIVVAGSNKPSYLTVNGCLIYACRTTASFVAYSDQTENCPTGQTKVTFLDPQVTTCSAGYIYVEGTPNCVTTCPAGYAGSLNTGYVRNTFTCKLI